MFFFGFFVFFMFFLFSDKVLRLQEDKTRACSLASVDAASYTLPTVPSIACKVREADDVNLDALRSYGIKSSKCARLVGSSLCTSVSSDSPARAARPRFFTRKQEKHEKHEKTKGKHEKQYLQEVGIEIPGVTICTSILFLHLPGKAFSCFSFSFSCLSCFSHFLTKF